MLKKKQYLLKSPNKNNSDAPGAHSRHVTELSEFICIPNHLYPWVKFSSPPSPSETLST